MDRGGLKSLAQRSIMILESIQILRRLVLLGILIGCSLPASATLNFYTVDFSSPPNQIGQPPATGIGSTTPSSIVFGSPLVVGSFGNLTNQPLVFSGIDYQQIQFDLNRGVPSYFVDFDFETRNLSASLFSFAIVCDTRGAEVFYLHGRDYIGVPPANSPYLPGWTDGDLHHMHIGMDLSAATWTLQLDTRAPATGPFYSDSGDILSLRMDLSAWRAFTPDDPNVQVAIDNIVIASVVPEPSSATLIVFGILLMRARSMRRLRNAVGIPSRTELHK